MIQINRRWAIKRSKMAVSLCKSLKVKGKIEWREQYYYSDVPAAMEKLIDIAVLRGIDKGSWQAVVDEINAVRADISAIKESLKGIV